MTDPTPFAPRAAAKAAPQPRTSPVLLLAMTLLAAFVLLIAALPSGAQEALTEPALAGATPGGTDAAGQADSDIWREIRQGGTGVWGPDVMPPQPQVSAAEARSLVQYILSLK